MRARSILLAAALAVVAGGVVASPAWADPAGCSHTTPNFWLTGSSSNYQMHSDASGSCSSSATRTFRVEIKQDKPLAPDPVAGADDDHWTGTSYYAYARTCDHGNNATYYGRSFWTGDGNYKDTSHFYVETCN